MRYRVRSKLSVTTVCHPVMDVAADVQEAQVWCGGRIGWALMGVWAAGKQSEPRHLVCYPAMDVAADVQEAQVWCGGRSGSR